MVQGISLNVLLLENMNKEKKIIFQKTGESVGGITL